MKHNIVMTCEAKTPDALLLKRQIRKCILAALDEEGVDVPCEINVLLTDDASIRAINKAYRNIDKATDVLSFPMFELTPGKLPESWDEYKDPETGRVPLSRAGKAAGAGVRALDPARGRLSHDSLNSAPAGL